MRTKPIYDNELVKDIIVYLDEKNQRDKLLFIFGIYTGLRVSDLLKLKVYQVRDKRFIYIKEKKTNKNKKITFNKKLRQEIQKYTKDKARCDYLFRSRQGYNNPISYSTVYRIFKDIEEQFDLEGIATHTMRKTFAFNIFTQNGKNIILTQKALNHSDFRVTEEYLGVDQMLIDDAVLRLEY